ncbi:glycoside hydrolase family 71/99-like protein [Neorhodopirellula pilleata]|uniref:Glycosyl hydrolase family 71 n=1 Tax=Neorhodopirellula pilleata TaxID=2714738 RepID=A0A5C5ZQQ1_9BACT|nr:glycoside hydrolase family 71/99-like protein [Neorhodopirellula pilleata]TWT89395.1 hypothetical protein Pla100_55580 [Neorhodopirellula pilleata]
MIRVVLLMVVVGATAFAPNPPLYAQPPVRNPTILAHYMPWYAAKPMSERWGWHWTMDRFDPEKTVDGQREIASHYYPIIGPYDSGDEDVIECHLLMMKAAGIDGVIVDWYGLTDLNDYAILHRNTTRVLQQCERLKMKFVICYEDQTIPKLVDAQRIDATERVSHAASEIQWLTQYWFQSPAYLKLDDRPILLSFGHAGLNDDEWTQCLVQVPTPIAYFSQDYRRSCAVGGFGWPSPRNGLTQVGRFASEAQKWTHAIPAAFPRFNDIYSEANVSEGYPILDDNQGRTLSGSLMHALKWNPVAIQIATWNDWGEGTQIEPSREFGFRDLEIIQRVLKSRQSGSKIPESAALALPLELLKLRRNQSAPKRTLDELADLMADREWDRAESSWPTSR